MVAKWLDPAQVVLNSGGNGLLEVFLVALVEPEATFVLGKHVDLENDPFGGATDRSPSMKRPPRSFVRRPALGPQRRPLKGRRRRGWGEGEGAEGSLVDRVGGGGSGEPAVDGGGRGGMGASWPQVGVPPAEPPREAATCAAAVIQPRSERPNIGEIGSKAIRQKVRHHRQDTAGRKFLG